MKLLGHKIIVYFFMKKIVFNFSWQVLYFILFFSFIFISWRLITLQYCSGFCHTLTWISHGFTYIPHPNPPSHLPLYPIPLGLPSALGPSTNFIFKKNLCQSIFDHVSFRCIAKWLCYTYIYFLKFFPHLCYYRRLS